MVLSQPFLTHDAWDPELFQFAPAKLQLQTRIADDWSPRLIFEMTVKHSPRLHIVPSERTERAKENGKKGAAWGVILWLVAQLVVMPMMGAGVFSSKIGGAMPAMASLIGHLVYGSLLGAVAGGMTKAAARLSAAQA